MEHVARVANTEHQENNKNKHLDSSIYTWYIDKTVPTHQLDKFHDERFCDQIFSCKSHICSFTRFPPSEKAFTPVVFSVPYLLKCLFIRAGDKDRNVSAHYFLLYQFHEQSKLGRSSNWAIDYRGSEEAERMNIIVFQLFQRLKKASAFFHMAEGFVHSQKSSTDLIIW